MKVLVLNSGSSSLKYRIVDTDLGETLLDGVVDRIGAGGAILTQVRVQDGIRIREAAPSVADHRGAIGVVLDRIQDPEGGGVRSVDEILAVGHRVVHGGEHFTAPVLVDRGVLEGIRDSLDLAPLHNPHNLTGILAARERLPDVPHVAVFDTAFHATLEPPAFLYGLPYVLYHRHRIRRYGFHGTSHAHVALRGPELAGLAVKGTRTISLHLGNGASACAIAGGRSVETSMGFTPLEGLVMGTRSGDVDPAVILHVMAKEELSVAEASALLNKHSGLRGISGISSDMRDLLQESRAGNERALLALEVYVWRIRKYIGAYAAVLGGVDLLAFTGGVGENSPEIRARVLEGLGFLGIQVESARNALFTGGSEGPIHGGTVPIVVVRNGEELVIAREAARLALLIPGEPPPNR